MNDQVKADNKRIWITWERQRRNKGISEKLNFTLYEILSNTCMLKRYIICLFSTFKIIIKTTPTVVVAQNPSLILGLEIIIFKFFFRYKAVIDAHNSGIYPLEGRSNILMLISRFIQKHADITLVTNNHLKKNVEKNGGKAFVLQDAIPSVPHGINHMTLQKKTTIAFICTFAKDEPYVEVFEASKKLKTKVSIYVTGNYDRKINPHSISDNIILLGHITDSEYWSLLKSVEIVMDLTLRENCLVCGAYEAIAVGKPLILSNTKALKSYFNKGCVWVSPTAESISFGIEEMIKRHEEMKKDILLLRTEIKSSWERKIMNLENLLSTYTS